MWLVCSFPVSSQLTEMGQVRWAALLPLRASLLLGVLPLLMSPYVTSLNYISWRLVRLAQKMPLLMVTHS